MNKKKGKEKEEKEKEKKSSLALFSPPQLPNHLFSIQNAL
jgi:hypothetical protein